MKTGRLTWVAAGVVVGLGLARCGAAGAEEVQRAFERFQQAFLAADTAELGRLLSDDYRHTNGGSPPIDRQAWLAWVEGRRERVEAGTLVYDGYAVDELEIRVHGDSAVVTGRARGHGRDDDRAFTVDVRFTQLWIRESGRWLRAAFQDAKVPDDTDRPPD